MAGELIVKSVLELDDAANQILNQFPAARVFALYGKMGAGKTTFIKSLCKQLQVVETVNSPTFSIVNEYVTEAGEQVYHFDFYRLKKAEEAFDIGIEDYFYSQQYCFLEWPEKIADLLPENFVSLTVEETGNGEERRIRFN